MKPLPLGLSSLALTQPETISPDQQVLRACAATYKSLREFKGGAAVISLKLLQTGDIPPTMIMQNADASFDFVRDNRFNISGHDTTHQPFEIASTPQKTTQTWQPAGKKQTDDAKDIEMAVAGFTGIAAGAPTTIPALLLSSSWGFPFRVKGDATLEGTEVFSGHQCYIIVQKEEAKDIPETRTLWIDAKTFLLHGMREERGESSFVVDIPPTDAPMNNPAPQQMQVKVLYSNHMYIFSAEKTLPSEAELETAAQKTIDTPLLDTAAGH